MNQLLKLISKSKKETPKITVQTMKLRSTVHPDNKMDINDWYRYVHLSNDPKRKG